MTKNLSLALIAVSFVALSAVPAVAQAQDEASQPIGTNAGIFQPSPEFFAKLAEDTAPATPAKEEVVRGTSIERKVYRSSQIALIAMLATDMAVTSYNLTHPLHASYTAQDLHTVVVTTTFKEVGWAKMFSETNPVPVVVANAAMGAGILYASHKLYGKGGIWKKVAAGLNFYQASQNVVGTLHCLDARSYSQRDLVPTGVFQVIRW